MKAHLRYLSYVLRHKYFVLIECIRLKIPLLGITHDLSKFLPREWSPYAKWFEGKRGAVINNNKLKFGTVLAGDPTDMVVMGSKNIGVGVWEIEILPIARKYAFDKAWLQHQNANPHHWQYWLLTLDGPGDMREALAENAHDSWCGWMEYQSGFWTEDDDHATSIDTDKVLRWSRQMATNYEFLTEREKESDRREADNILEIIQQFAPKPQPMPLKYAKEMLADWRGASRAQGKNRTTDVVAWYMKRRDRFRAVLHDDTRLWIEGQLGICADA